jgi:hypothetical protein
MRPATGRRAMKGVKFVRCLRAASILQALIVTTELRGFRRVDSP